MQQGAGRDRHAVLHAGIVVEAAHLAIQIALGRAEQPGPRHEIADLQGDRAQAHVLDQDRGGRGGQDVGAQQQGLTHQVDQHVGLGPRQGRDLDRGGAALGGHAAVDDLALGHDAVGDGGHVLAIGLDPDRAPVHLHHQALDIVADGDAVADVEGLLDADGDAGEHVGQGVLQRQAQHDGDDAGGGQHPLHRQAQHRVQHDQGGGDVDHPRHQVGKQSGLARAGVAAQRDGRARHHQPCADQPPDHVQRA